MIRVLCLACREPFAAERRSAKFCSTRCRSRHHRHPTAEFRRKTATVSDVSVARLHVLPLLLREANAVIEKWHRHHRARWNMHTFSLGAVRDSELVGAAIISRPAARHYNAREVAEVARPRHRLHPHVASMLYAAAARACTAMGYKTIQTYILDREPGTSLRACSRIASKPVVPIGERIRTHAGADTVTAPCRQSLSKDGSNN